MTSAVVEAPPNPALADPPGTAADPAERWLLATILVPYLGWGLHYIYRTSFVVDGTRVFCLWDDAMISMRYAANLSVGQGLAWNVGEAPVQGFTNLGVTLVMALVHLLPLPPTATSLAVQLLALALLGAVIALVHALARSRGANAIEAGTVALAVAICAPVAIWGLQGSDTSFVAAWLIGAVLWQARAGSGSLGLVMWLAVGALLRLDCLIYTAVFLAFAGVRLRHAPGALLLRGALVALVPAAVLAFGALYYGEPLPNTFHLKATGSPLWLVLESGLVQLLAWWGLFPALGVAAFAAFRSGAGETERMCAALVVVALLYHVQVGGDWLTVFGSRFVVPVLPLLLWLATRGCFAAASASSVAGRLPAWLPPTALASATALLLAYVVSPGLARHEWSSPSAAPLLRSDNQRHARLGLYLRAHTAPGTTLALHWAGVPAYFSERPAIDVLGRSDRHIARLEVPRFVPGHSKWDWDYVLGERPDVFLIVSRGLGKRADFLREYAHVKTPGGLEFYLRRESRARLEDPAVVLSDPAP